MSHSCRFVLFPDPMGACPWIARALEPWLDQPIVGKRGATMGSHFFCDMSPAEAELAFDMAGFAFRNYARIAIIRNPLNKMPQLYDRIAATDKVWRMRRRVGASNPSFTRWLSSTRPNGFGAAPLGGPRWRRFGAWSAEDWCGDHISHIVRAEHAEDELSKVFQEIGLSPVFGGRALDALKLKQPSWARYGQEAREIVRDRYAWDLSFYENNSAVLKLVA